jgi:hypothetical protein
VGVVEGGAHRLDDEEGGGDVEAGAGGRVALEAGERDAVDRFHDEVGLVGVDAEVEDLDDVAVGEALDDLGLGAQQRGDAGARGELAADLLDDDALAEAAGSVEMGQIHFAEPAAPEPLADDVSAQASGPAHPPMIRHRDSFPARIARGCVVWAVAVTARPAAAEEVLVWPRTPTTATAEAEAALRAAGHRPREFAGLRAQMIAEDAAAQAAARAALAEVERDLASARAAFLGQRYAEMIAALERAEATAVATLGAGPACVATVWELEFQLGLALLSRGQAGDAERARARFAVALAVDPQRRPEAGLYGPDVGLAFVQAVDAVARTPARPIAVTLAPDDAAIAVDCRPVTEAGLRPGLHVVRVEAPGFNSEARVVEVGAAGELQVALRADAAGPLGAWWVRGGLDPIGASARAAVQARVGAVQVIWLVEEDAQHVARAMSAGQLRRVARAATAGEAVVQVLAVPVPTRDRPAQQRRPRRRAGLWIGLASAALGGVALGLGLGLGLPAREQAHLKLVVP